MKIVEQSVAKVTKIYGQNGELVLRLFDTFQRHPNLKEPLFADISGLTVPFYFKTFTTRGANKAVVVFEDIDNIIRAEELIGKELFVFMAEQAANDDGELYFDQLVGYKLTDSLTFKSGEIVEYIDNDDNPLLRIDFDGVEGFVPASDDFIDNIDVDKRVVEVTLPDGLLDLYLA